MTIAKNIVSIKGNSQWLRNGSRWGNEKPRLLCGDLMRWRGYCLAFRSVFHHLENNVGLLRSEAIEAADMVEKIFRGWRLAQQRDINNIHTANILGEDLFCQLSQSPIHQVTRLLQTMRCGVDASRHAWVYCREKRKHLKAELVSCGVGQKIGAVCYIVLSAALEIVLNILSRHTEKRTDHCAVNRPDACHAVESGATNEIHQHSLHIVVAMVCHHNGIGTDVAAEIMEIGIAEIACRRLYALLVERGILTGVEMHTVEPNSEARAKANDKLLVAVSLLATQMEIAVDSLNAIAPVVHHQQQGNTVGSTADRYEIEFVSV